MSQVESSSSQAVKSAGTPFVWAKLVAGQKQNLIEVEAEEKAKAAEEKAKAELAAHNRRENVIQDFEVRRISKLKADLARIGKLAEFEKKMRKKSSAKKLSMRDTRGKMAGGVLTLCAILTTITTSSVPFLKP